MCIWNDAIRSYPPELVRVKRKITWRILRRYLHIDPTDSFNTDLRIHRKPLSYGKDLELIIVPAALAPCLVTALPPQLGHPPKTQFKKVWDHYFFTLDRGLLIDNCTLYVHHCVHWQWSCFRRALNVIPMLIGRNFSIDIIRREGEKSLLRYCKNIL